MAHHQQLHWRDPAAAGIRAGAAAAWLISQPRTHNARTPTANSPGCGARATRAHAPSNPSRIRPLGALPPAQPAARWVVAARLPVAVPAQGRPSYFSQRLQPHGQAPSAAHHAAAQPRAPSAAWLSCALCRAERNNRLRAEQLARTAEARGRAQLRAALEVRQVHEQERRAVSAELGALERELRDLVRDRECVRARPHTEAASTRWRPQEHNPRRG